MNWDELRSLTWFFCTWYPHLGLNVLVELLVVFGVHCIPKTLLVGKNLGNFS